MSGTDVAEQVPDEVIPHKYLPPLTYRDMPAPVPWQRMMGPSLILAGLALGSGEFILWPNIVYHSGFVFFWACLLGAVTQFYINMEIERWTLLTGESAITGFCRLSPHWAWIFLILNLVPWAWPGWATGAAQMLSWLVWGPQIAEVNGALQYGAYGTTAIAIASLVLVGLILTAGPVVYNTVESAQSWLVISVLLLIAVIGVITIRWDAIAAMGTGLTKFGTLPDLTNSPLSMMTLLGALAFAGVGGTLNLGQSNYIKEKGYGMGSYVGRITSPLTGREEPISEIGYHFHHTDENLSRWRGWWRAANIEHFVSFLMTCLVCLVFLSLITYSLLYDETGQLRPAATGLGGGFNFVWAQAIALGEGPAGGVLKLCYLVAGIAILLTTELGVLDTVSRIAADIVKVNYLRDNDSWSLSRLYFLFLWAEVALGSGILLSGLDQPILLIELSAAMNGAVMFIYCAILLYMNSKILSRGVAIGPFRFVVMIWACAFFGYFTLQAFRLAIVPLVMG